MNADAAFEILQEANPVPDPDRYRQITAAGHSFLAATKERILHMETLTPAPEKQEPPSRRSGLAIAATVFVVVVVLGVSLALRPQQPDVVVPAPTTVGTTIPEPPTTVVSIPGPPFSTPTEAAEAYLTAKFTGDYQELEPLMGVDGRNTSYMFQSPGDAERLQMRFAWEQATRDSYSDLECVELPNLIADCTYIAEDLLQTRMGNDGITHTQSFRLDPDGLLLSVGLEEPAFTEEHRSVARAFTMWLIDHYPDLIAEEDAVFGTGDVARPVEEILADWMAAIDEFLAENG